MDSLDSENFELTYCQCKFSLRSDFSISVTKNGEYQFFPASFLVSHDIKTLKYDNHPEI